MEIIEQANKTFILLILILMSCQAKKEKSNELTYWSSNDNKEIEFVRTSISLWNKDHETKVSFQPVPEGQSSEEVVMAAVVGRTTPDIYANMWQGLVELYSNSGVLIALDTIGDFKEFITKRCGQKVVDEITSSDGHIYQVPWKINPIMTIFNKKLLQSIGYENAPPSYSEFLKAGALFSKDFDGDGYPDQWVGDTEVKNIWHQRLMNFYPLYLGASNGAPLIKDGKAAFNNQHAIGVFAFLQTIYSKGYFANESNSAGSDKFLAGKLATKWTGPWDVSHIEKFKPDGFEYEIASLPVPDNHEGPIYTYGDPKNIVVFNTCENPKEAWQFIRSLIDEEGDVRFFTTTRQLPRRINLLESPLFESFFEEEPKLKKFAEQAKYIYGTDNCEVLIEVLDIISQEYESCVLHSQKTPKQAIEDAERAVNVLLGNF